MARGWFPRVIKPNTTPIHQYQHAFALLLLLQCKRYDMALVRAVPCRAVLSFVQCKRSICHITKLNYCMVMACRLTLNDFLPTSIDPTAYALVTDAYKITCYLYLLACLLSQYVTHSTPGEDNLKQIHLRRQKQVLPLPSATHLSDWQQWCSWSSDTSLSLKVACS